MTGVLGSALARVSVRPSLIAYLIRQRDQAQYLDAVMYASTEWGGYAHPVITGAATRTNRGAISPDPGRSRS